MIKLLKSKTQNDTATIAQLETKSKIFFIVSLIVFIGSLLMSWLTGNGLYMAFFVAYELISRFVRLLVG